MLLSNIGFLLPFLEFSFYYDNKLTPLEGYSEGKIDSDKLSKALISRSEEALWVDYSEISASPNRLILQLDLLGHSDEPVLILKNTNTKESGFYVFKFRRYESSEQLFYGKDQKSLILSIIRLWVSNYANQNTPEIENFKKYFQIAKNQTIKIDYLNKELYKRDLETKKIFTMLFTYFLKEELLPSQKISLSDSAIEFLREGNFAIEDLQKMAVEAFNSSRALYPSSAEVRIRKYYLISPDSAETAPITVSKPVKVQTEQVKIAEKPYKPSEATKKSIPKPINRSKLLKTINLLDRYEQAVQKLIDQKLPIMGKNIASACEPPISAPALTDSINKHRQRIISCLAEYPDKWPLLNGYYHAIRKIS